MRLKNVLLVVHDMELSKKFYRELFGLDVLTDFGENVILTEGLVLQEQKSWEKLLGKSMTAGGNDAELYFEENDLDIFLEKVKSWPYPLEYVSPCAEQEGGRRVVRLYDPDRHVLEVRETAECAWRRDQMRDK